MTNRYVPLPDIVYCQTHYCVHDRSTMPYDEGYPSCDSGDWRPVYWRARKDDYENEERVERG